MFAVARTTQFLLGIHIAHIKLYDMCDMSPQLLSRRPLTASARDQQFFVAGSELDRLRGAVKFGLNVHVGGGPGSGKTTLLRRIEHECGSAAVFVRAEPSSSTTTLLDEVARAIRQPDDYRPSRRPTGTELDVRYLEDVLSHAIDSWGDESEPPEVVLVDGAVREHLHVLFGRYRDALWELPLTWIVASRLASPPRPADAFFDRSIQLDPWPIRRIQRLIETRMPDWSVGWCADVAATLGPATPTQALLDLQSLALGGDQTALIAALADDRSQVAELPVRLRKFYAALCQAGPTHAGDEWLLETAGVTRSRVVHWLKELEALGLVEAERDGRRVNYTARRYSYLSKLLGNQAASRAASDQDAVRSVVEASRAVAEAEPF